MIYHNIFGVRGVALGRCAVLIAELLAVDMVERESDYLGCYFAGAGSDFNVRIVEQPDPEGELLEPEHQDYDVIIYLDGQSQFESVEGCVVDSSSIVRLNL